MCVCVRFVYVFERPRQLVYPLVESPNACNNQGWATPKAVVGTFILISHMGGGDLNTDHLPCPSQAHKQKAGLEAE